MCHRVVYNDHGDKVKSAGFCVHRFDLVHQNSSQKQSHYNCHNIMSMVPLGPGKFKQNKVVFFLVEKAETQRDSKFLMKRNIKI